MLRNGAAFAATPASKQKNAKTAVITAFCTRLRGMLTVPCASLSVRTIACLLLFLLEL
jgi:hypothetical protein